MYFCPTTGRVWLTDKYSLKCTTISERRKKSVQHTVSSFSQVLYEEIKLTLTPHFDFTHDWHPTCADWGWDPTHTFKSSHMTWPSCTGRFQLESKSIHSSRASGLSTLINPEQFRESDGSWLISGEQIILFSHINVAKQCLTWRMKSVCAGCLFVLISDPQKPLCFLHTANTYKSCGNTEKLLHSMCFDMYLWIRGWIKVTDEVWQEMNLPQTL